MTEGRLTRAGFDIDLRKYEAREGTCAKVLLSRGTHLIEHKRDEGCVKTGNLFIEYCQPSGPSGIATTQSHHWAFEFDDNCWILIPTERLKSLSRAAYSQGRRRNGGDFHNYTGVLLPVRWLVPPYIMEVAS